MTQENSKQKVTHEGEVALLRQTLQTSGNVYSLAFSSDGQSVASESTWKSSDGVKRAEIQLWLVQTGSLRRTLRPSEPGILVTVVCSPDGPFLACGSGHQASPDYWDSAVQLWDTGTGLLQQTFPLPNSIVGSVAFSPNGKTLASGSVDWRSGLAVSEVRLWDLKTGEIKRRVEVPSCSVWALAFSPEGALLAAGGGLLEGRRPGGGWTGGEIYLLNVESGDIQHTLIRTHARAQSKVAFSPDGRRLASGNGPEGDILFWNTQTGELQQTLHGHAAEVYAVAFSPDGTLLASGARDESVKLWDAATGQLLQTLTGHTNPVHAVAFSPDGKMLATGDIDRVVRLWSIEKL